MARSTLSKSIVIDGLRYEGTYPVIYDRKHGYCFTSETERQFELDAARFFQQCGQLTDKQQAFVDRMLDKKPE